MKQKELTPEVAAEVFNAKKEVTKKDAKYLKNLLGYRLNELRKARWSDNWFVFAIGSIIWFSLGLCLGITIR